jgi:hypothetical protein
MAAAAGPALVIALVSRLERSWREPRASVTAPPISTSVPYLAVAQASLDRALSPLLLTAVTT